MARIYTNERARPQRCSELFSNSLGTKPEGRRPKTEIPQGGTEDGSLKRRTAREPVCPSDFGLRASFGVKPRGGHAAIRGSRTPTSSRARDLSEFRPSDLCCPNDLCVGLERPWRGPHPCKPIWTRRTDGHKVENVKRNRPQKRGLLDGWAYADSTTRSFPGSRRKVLASPARRGSALVRQAT